MISRRDFLKIAGTGAAGAALSACGGGDGGNGGGDNGGGNGGGGRDNEGSLNSIEHIIFTMQENRSFDHYFGKLPQYRAQRGIPGEVDGIPDDASNPSRDDTSVLIHAHHLDTQCHENLSPAWNEAHRQFNRVTRSAEDIRLDGFVYTAANFSRSRVAQGDPNYFDTEGTRAMGYYDERDIPFYYDLFSQFPISDRWFSSVPSSTLANRMYMMAGSSYGLVVPPERGTAHQFNEDTIFDVLERNGISWKIYLNNPSGDFTYYAWFSGFNRHQSKIVNAEQFFEDARNGTLPSVAMVESGVRSGLDEHPLNNIQKGAQYMRRFFRALMDSPLWTKSAMILTYDEGGGFYDHVVPPSAPKPDDIAPVLRESDAPGDFDRYGFRVPAVLVSPWAKPNYVSHQVADHTSILALIERRFNLPALTNRDANAHDLLDMFDFSEMKFEQPPSLAEQPTGGVCRFSEVAS